MEKYPNGKIKRLAKKIWPNDGIHKIYQKVIVFKNHIGIKKSEDTFLHKNIDYKAHNPNFGK